MKLVFIKVYRTTDSGINLYSRAWLLTKKKNKYADEKHEWAEKRKIEGSSSALYRHFHINESRLYQLKVSKQIFLRSVSVISIEIYISLLNSSGSEKKVLLISTLRINLSSSKLSKINKLQNKYPRNLFNEAFFISRNQRIKAQIELGKFQENWRNFYFLRLSER